MSHTNSTTNYALPQFLTGDKPAWLTDINNAFSDIDTAVYNAQTKADTAYTDAGNAQGDATTAINNAAAADAKGSGAIASIEAAFDPTTIYSVGAKVMYNSLLYRCVVAVVTPGPWTGSDNWERITVDTLISSTDAKVGTLSSLSTTDKSSLVNAVNEVNGRVNQNTWVDATNQFTKSSYFDNGQTSYFLYNAALNMYAVSFAVKASTPDESVILSNVPTLRGDIQVLPCGFANAGGLGVNQVNVIYYKASNSITLRISSTTNVPIFVTAFLMKA